MKKSIKYLLIIFLLLLGITKINALELSQSDYESYNIRRSYVVGKYIFDLSRHNPTLKDLMLAAQSSPAGDVSIIEIKIATNIDGEKTKEYKELLSAKKLIDFPNLDVDYIYKSEIMPNNSEAEDKIVLEETGSGDEPVIPDQTAPSCAWSTLTDDLSMNSTSTITLTCTDASGIKTTSLTSNVFEVTGNYTIQGIQTEKITEGYKYIVTLQGSDKGSGQIILKENSVVNNNEIGNKRLSSELFSVVKIIRGIFYKNGSEKIEFNNQSYTDETTEIILCTLTDKESCDATLPKIVGKGQTPTVIGWSTAKDDNIAKYESNVKVTLSDSVTLYAQTKGTIDIRFVANGCVTGDVTRLATLYNGKTSVNFIVPSASAIEGWTILGASRSASSTSGVAIGSALAFNVGATSKSVTAYYNCKKEAQTFTVTFTDSHLAKSNLETKTCTIPAVYNGATQATSCEVVAVTLSTNNGWTFNGWGTSTSSTSGSIASGGKIAVSNNITYYATWYKPLKTFAVTFTDSHFGNRNLGTKTCNIPAVYNGATQATSCEVTAVTLSTNNGWTFNGWGTSSSSTSGIASGREITVTNNTTYYATWIKPVKTFIVTFTDSHLAKGNLDTKACTIPPAYNGATQAASCEVTAVTLGTNNGWTFNGWGTSSSSTSGIASGTKITVTNNATYYATWIKHAKTFTVTFTDSHFANRNLGTKTCTIPTVYNGATQAASCEVTAMTLSQSNGWTFNGWGTSSSSTSGSIASGGKITITNNTTYYATWMKPAITYTASLSCNGGIGTVSSTSCTIPAVYNGATQNLSCSISTPTSGCSRNGWTFVGWNANNSATTGFTGSTAISQNHTYYAVWAKPSKTYTVSFNGNGGTGSTGSLSCTIPAAYNGATQATSCNVTLPNNGYSYSGWTFNGWGTSSTTTSGTGAGATLTLSSNLTRYAIWKKPSITYTVLFNGNGGTGSTSPVSCTIPAAYNGATQATSCNVTLPNNGYNYSGWTFNGWGISSTSTSGTGAGVTSLLSSNETLYATWKKTFTLTCNIGTNVSTIGVTSRTCTVYNGSNNGCPVILPSITANTGYTSVGWNASNGAISGTAPGTLISLTSNSTLYANATDQTAPNCGVASGEGSSSNWATSRTITVACSETGGSGCSQGTFSETFDSGISTSGIITISDNAGNTRDCTVATYIDAVKPTITCTVTKNGLDGVTVEVKATDNSGSLVADPSGTYDKLKTFQRYTATDNVGNSESCTVNVTQTINSYIKEEYACSTPIWNSPTVSYTSMSGCTGAGGGAMDSSKTTCVVESSSVCTSNGQSIPCLRKEIYTRKGCSAYSSTVSTTTYPTSCIASKGTYSEIKCKVNNYMYTGKAN